MKNTKKLTRNQKIALSKAGVNPADYRLVVDNGSTFEVISNDMSKRCTYTYTGKRVS